MVLIVLVAVLVAVVVLVVVLGAVLVVVLGAVLVVVLGALVVPVFIVAVFGFWFVGREFAFVEQVAECRAVSVLWITR